MSTIPKKGDNTGAEQQQEARRQQKIGNDITSITDQIVEAMGKNKNCITIQLGWPEPEAQKQIAADFAKQGWTVTFNPARTGGNISWS